MSYKNYYGVWLPDTGGAQNWVGGAPGAWVSGTGMNDQIASGGHYSTLAGGGGDDFYWLNDGSETVVEQPGQGIDTIQVWQSYKLPDNVENLIVFGTGQFAKGNNLDNIIKATGSGDTLYGGYGSDVLVGSPGAGDAYMIVRGEGAKAIEGFLPGQYSSDIIRLQNSPLHSFAQVQAAMSQVGSDVVINDGGEPIVIRNTQTWQFTANNFQLPLDTSALGSLSFNDDFNSLQWADPSKGYGGSTGWYPSFGDGHVGTLGDYTLPRNNEQQIYTSPFFAGSSGTSPGLNPFSVNNGVLTISATPVNDWQSQQMWGYKYSSGAITTEWSHLQTYGYFEMRAQLPTGQGMWPAFWLEGGGTEIDMLEAVGNAPGTAYVGYHSPAGGDHTIGVAITPTSDNYHTFGVLWTPTDLIYYVDGNEVLDTATPSDMNKPMWMIANLAVGGGWAGLPDGTTAWPENFNIDYIRAYNLPGQGGSPVVQQPAPPVVQQPAPPPASSGSSGSTSSGGQVYVSDQTYSAPSDVTNITLTASGQTVTGNNAGDVFNSNNNGNRLIGGTGADTFYIGRGGDTVTGGGGNDKFVFNDNPWAGGHITDFNAGDQIDITTTLSKAGYHGTDPVGAGYVKIGADSAGNAQLWIDPNGWYGGGGWWLATTLDGVQSGTLKVNGGVITTSAAGGSTGSTSTSGSSSSSTPSSGGNQVYVSDSTYKAPSGVTNITLTASGQTVTGNDSGDIFYSNNHGNHLIGGGGNDTFYVGRGGDTVTGGGGNDKFVFNDNPWAGGHITDFNAGDQIDLSGTLSKAGYYGSDPVGAGYVKITADSSGNAQVWIDPNGWYGAGGWWLATTLDGVQSGSVHVNGGIITTDASGATSGSASGGGGQGQSVVTSDQWYVAPSGVTGVTLSGWGQTVTANDQGDTLYSNSNAANHLIGGAGNDTFHIGRAGDTVTGGAGADTFVFDANPWAGGHITDFNPWQDKIDLTPTLAKASYAGSDPMGAGFVKIDSDASGSARIWIDPNGGYGAHGWWLATTVDGVSPNNLHEHGGLFFA